MGDAGRATIPYLERGVGAALAGMRKVFRKKNDRHRFTGARLAGRNHVDEAVARVVAAGEISARSYDLRAPDLHPLAVSLHCRSRGRFGLWPSNHLVWRISRSYQHCRKSFVRNVKSKATLESYGCQCPFGSDVRTRACCKGIRTSEPGH